MFIVWGLLNRWSCDFTVKTDKSFHPRIESPIKPKLWLTIDNYWYIHYTPSMVNRSFACSVLLRTGFSCQCSFSLKFRRAAESRGRHCCCLSLWICLIWGMIAYYVDCWSCLMLFHAVDSISFVLFKLLLCFLCFLVVFCTSALFDCEVNS